MFRSGYTTSSTEGARKLEQGRSRGLLFDQGILHQAQKGLGNLNKVGLGGYYLIRVYSIKHGRG